MMEMNERREIEIFNQLCRDHIEHAREKHPRFADNVSTFKDGTLKVLARYFRASAKRDSSIYYVLISEVFEFLDELQNGDYDRAQEEAADIVAVLWRALRREHEAPKGIEK